jgi:Domain of unknown function DUF29
MGTTTKTLYDTDFVEWSSQTAELLRAGSVGEVDLANVAEEIESLGKRDRWAARSQMLRLLVHQIKRRIQPERESASWRHSIVNSQERIAGRLIDSPSLKRMLEKDLGDIYSRAVRGALFETGVKTAQLPERCPFTLDQLLEEFNLNWPS